MTSSDDKTMKVIENGFHHLYIESDEVRKEAISETWDWIVKRVWKNENQIANLVYFSYKTYFTYIIVFYIFNKYNLY